MPVKTNNTFLLEAHRETARRDWRWMEDSAELPVTFCSLTINFNSTLNACSSHAGEHTHTQTEKCMQTHVAINESTCLSSSSFMSALFGVTRSHYSTSCIQSSVANTAQTGVTRPLQLDIDPVFTLQHVLGGHGREMHQSTGDSGGNLPHHNLNGC